MRVHYRHPVPLPPREERALLSAFYREMQRQPRGEVPLHAKGFELTCAQKEQREKELLAFLKYGPWQEEILAAGRQRAGLGKEARSIGIGIAVCGAVACFASPLLGTCVIVAGMSVSIIGARKKERNEGDAGLAAKSWGRIVESARAQMSSY